MSREEEEHVAEVAAQILTHMLRNPQAVDTLEGLTRFRLLEERIRQRMADTDKALQWLVKTGLILEEKTGEGHRAYRLNPVRISDARRVGKQRPTEDS